LFFGRRGSARLALAVIRWEPTFGLVAVDRTTFERHPTPTLAWLGAVARANAI